MFSFFCPPDKSTSTHADRSNVFSLFCPPDKSTSTRAARSINNETNYFDGIAVTSIDYKNAPTDDHPDRITFAEYTPGNERKRLNSEDLNNHNRDHVDAAIFIHNIKFLEGDEKNKVISADVDGKRLFEADKLPVEKVKAEFETLQKTHYETKDEGYTEGQVKPLFAIHGYYNEPGYTLKTCAEAQKTFDEGGRKTAIIPVIWPNFGTALAYDTDQNDNVPEAVKEMTMLLDKVMALGENIFDSKNLLCHSMGNQVFRKVANANVKFDNILLVSADIRHNIFDEEYINRAENENAKERDGLRIIRMLAKDTNDKHKGKIYCLYNGSDYALGISSWKNGVNRLGQVGIGSYDSWGPGWTFNEKGLLHPEVYGHTENFNAYNELTWGEYKAHSYNWMKFSINYYKKKIE